MNESEVVEKGEVVIKKYAVVKGQEWFMASSLRQVDGAFDTYDQAMREASRLNYKLAAERSLLDEKMPGYPFDI